MWKSFSSFDQEYVRTQLEDYQDSLSTFLEDNYEEARMEDIFGAREIEEKEYSVFPLSLPYEVAEVHDELSALSGDHRQHLELKVEDELGLDSISFTRNRLFTISYNNRSFYFKSCCPEYVEAIGFNLGNSNW